MDINGIKQALHKSRSSRSPFAWPMVVDSKFLIPILWPWLPAASSWWPGIIRGQSSNRC